ncbi:hypothetical protein, partial [Longimycelium tulufanense]|uniref:hypothetical protein n=1 Tax=Longimycelium tulufanense TaxID=907463 RepID=UPI001E559879
MTTTAAAEPDLTDRRAQRTLAKARADIERANAAAARQREQDKHALALRKQAAEVEAAELANAERRAQWAKDEKQARKTRARNWPLVVLIGAVIAFGIYTAWRSQYAWFQGLGVPADIAAGAATVLEVTGVSLGILARRARRQDPAAGHVERSSMWGVVWFAATVNVIHNTGQYGPVAGVVYGFVSFTGAYLWHRVESVLMREQHGRITPAFGLRWAFYPWRTFAALRLAVRDGITDTAQALRLAAAERAFSRRHRRQWSRIVAARIDHHQQARMAEAERVIAEAEAATGAVALLLGSDHLHAVAHTSRTPSGTSLTDGRASRKGLRRVFGKSCRKSGAQPSSGTDGQGLPESGKGSANVPATAFAEPVAASANISGSVPRESVTDSGNRSGKGSADSSANVPAESADARSTQVTGTEMTSGSLPARPSARSGNEMLAASGNPSAKRSGKSSGSVPAESATVPARSLTEPVAASANGSAKRSGKERTRTFATSGNRSAKRSASDADGKITGRQAGAIARRVIADHLARNPRPGVVDAAFVRSLLPHNVHLEKTAIYDLVRDIKNGDPR